jgi:catalase
MLQRATSVDDVFIPPAFSNFSYFFMEDRLTMAHTRRPKRRPPRGQNRQVKVKGGELHQQAGPAGIPITTNQGLALSDNQNSLRAGDRGPSLLEDFILRDFDHERTPERIVRARGAGAHGYFQPYRSMKHVTKAAFLSSPSQCQDTYFRQVFNGRGGTRIPMPWLF